MNPVTLSIGHVLCTYVEPLVRGRRVALLGNPQLAEPFLELGARWVVVYDPAAPAELARVRSSSTERLGIQVLPFPTHGQDLGVRDGVFDLAVVPDLSEFPDADRVVALLRRMVGSAGRAVVAARNDEPASRVWLPSTTPSRTALGYHALYDVCSLQFADVRMLGVAPFAGYSIAEFAPDSDPGVTFDASLADVETSEWYVAVATQADPSDALDPYAVIQIPTTLVTVPSARSEVREKPSLPPTADFGQHKLREAEARAGDQYVRAERLAVELRASGEEARKSREQQVRLTKELEKVRANFAKLELEATELRGRPAADTLQFRERVVALEAELIGARTALATPRASPVELAKAQHDADLLSQELAVIRRSNQQLIQERDDLRHRLSERERELDAIVQRGKSLEDRLEDLLAENEGRDSEQAELRSRLSDTERAREVLEDQVRQVAHEFASHHLDHETDVQNLEVALRTRGDEVRAARVELARRERMIRELVVELQRVHSPVGYAPVAPTTPDTGDEARQLREEIRARDGRIVELVRSMERLSGELAGCRGQVEPLTREVAKREAALQAGMWRIAELEKGAGSLPESERQRFEAELDALRRALAQEHKSRTAAERLNAPTEEVAALHAKLQEREALLIQLASELSLR